MRVKKKKAKSHKEAQGNPKKNFLERFRLIFFKTKIRVALTTAFSLILSFLVLLSGVAFFFYSNHPKNITLAIETDSPVCVRGFFPLPKLYDIEFEDEISETFYMVTKVGSFHLYSEKLCLKSNKLLTSGEEYSGKAKMSIYEMDVILESEEYPEMIEEGIEIEAVNISEVLKFDLTKENDVFEYFIRIDDKSVPCNEEGTSLSCILSPFELAQGENYQIRILSVYNEKAVDSLYDSNIKILNSVKVSSVSIKEGEVLVDHSPTIEVKFSKAINEYSGIDIQQLKGEEYITVDNDDYGIEIVKNDDNAAKFEIAIEENLDSGEDYQILIDNIIAEDWSFIESPYVLKFKTSNGPNVSSSNLKSSGYSIGQSIVINWDETPLKGEDIKSKISLSPKVAFAVSTYGNKTTINPTSSLDRCTTYKLSVIPGVKSAYEVEGTQGFSSSFKTSCSTIYTVGTSVKGRKMYAYHFGNGSKKIIYFGSIHGNESNTQTLLYSWINELEANPNKIPNDVTVIVIPTLNPDGVSQHTRFNSNGVDLNRNFSTADWQAETYILDASYPDGGGSAPLSEPESKAIANYVLRYRPYLTLSYHSAAAVTIANDNSSSFSYGKRYASLSGYRYVPPTDSSTFTYPITGSFGRWAAENGLPALIIELATGYSSETVRNFPAMWEMIQ
jgi:murein peptide amidase A